MYGAREELEWVNVCGESKRVEGTQVPSVLARVRDDHPQLDSLAIVRPANCNGNPIETTVYE